jgi:hypothetical protein
MMAENEDLIYQQLNALINLYEHHLDLFWKWITLYSTVVGALVAYIFSKDISPVNKRLFPILIAIASLLVAFGCYIMWSWLRELEKQVKRFSKEVRIPEYPSFLGIRMTVAAMVATVLFAAASVLYSIYGSFG